MVRKGLVCLGMLLLMTPVFGLEQKAAPAAKPAAAVAVPAKAPMKKAVTAPGDEAGVKAAFDRFSKAWGAGDAKARAAVFTMDASVINPFGQEAWGQAEILRLFEQENATIAKGTQHNFDHFRITFVMPNLAIVDCDGTISGIKSPAGQNVPDQKLHIFVVAVKRTRDWQIRFARPAIFASLPGSEASMAAPPVAEPDVPEVENNMKDEKK